MDLAYAFPNRTLTSSFVAFQLGEEFQTRKWAGVLTSLANRGLLEHHRDAFLSKTFWTLPK